MHFTGNLFGAKWVIKIFFVGYEIYKQELCLRVCTDWSKPLLVKYDQIKKRTFTDEVKARH